MKYPLCVLLLAIPTLLHASEPNLQIPAPGPAHSCAAFYPRDAVRAHEEGLTRLAFTVTPQGTVANIAVEKSSGYSSLDEASVQCVRQWKYPPTAKDGVPVQLSKQANIEWSLGSGDPLPTLLQHAVQDCIGKAPPSEQAIASATGMTVVEIQFYGKDPPWLNVESSSGNGDLDKLVVGCLATLPPNIQVHPAFRLKYMLPFSWNSRARENPLN